MNTISFILPHSKNKIEEYHFLLCGTVAIQVFLQTSVAWYTTEIEYRLYSLEKIHGNIIIKFKYKDDKCSYYVKTVIKKVNFKLK